MQLLVNVTCLSDALCTVGQLCYINLKVIYTDMTGILNDFEHVSTYWHVLKPTIPRCFRNQFDREDFPQQSLMH